MGRRVQPDDSGRSWADEFREGGEITIECDQYAPESAGNCPNISIRSTKAGNLGKSQNVQAMHEHQVLGNPRRDVFVKQEGWHAFLRASGSHGCLTKMKRERGSNVI